MGTSEPCLTTYVENRTWANTLRHKSKSAPVVHNKKEPGPSCLRESSYSSSATGGSNKRSQIKKPSQRKLSVSFSDGVNVIRLEYIGEQWADDGWSDLFA